VTATQERPPINAETTRNSGPERKIGVVYRDDNLRIYEGGLVERVSLVSVGWEKIPTRDVLRNLTETRKKMYDGHEGMHSLHTDLIEELAKREFDLPPNPRSLLISDNQWTLGIEGETPRGAYMLPNDHSSSPEVYFSRKPKVLKEGEQGILALDFPPVEKKSAYEVA
jgi:hypothetical protein